VCTWSEGAKPNEDTIVLGQTTTHAPTLDNTTEKALINAQNGMKNNINKSNLSLNKNSTWHDYCEQSTINIRGNLSVLLLLDVLSYPISRTIYFAIGSSLKLQGSVIWIIGL
jgi:hypothetical protein